MANIPHWYPSIIEMDARYLQKGGILTITNGSIINFGDSDADLRIKNGKLQMKVNGLYYYIRLVTAESGITTEVYGNGET